MPRKPSSVYRNLDVDESADPAIGKPCTIIGYFLYNGANAARFLKLYDKATAATVGTDTPKLTIPLPSTAGANAFDPNGICSFAYGLSVGATTAVADSDTGAPGTNEVIINIFYNID